MVKLAECVTVIIFVAAAETAVSADHRLYDHSHLHPEVITSPSGYPNAICVDSGASASISANPSFFENAWHLASQLKLT